MTKNIERRLSNLERVVEVEANRKEYSDTDMMRGLWTLLRERDGPIDPKMETGELVEMVERLVADSKGGSLCLLNLDPG